jgi:hypothetical protein
MDLEVEAAFLSIDADNGHFFGLRLGGFLFLLLIAKSPIVTCRHRPTLSTQNAIR